MIALTVEEEGAGAAAKGVSINWCPYDQRDPRRDQWFRGWQAEMDKRRPITSGDSRLPPWILD